MEKSLSNQQIQDIYSFCTITKGVTVDECHAFIMRSLDCTYEFAKTVYAGVVLFNAFRGCLEEKTQQKH